MLDLGLVSQWRENSARLVAKAGPLFSLAIRLAKVASCVFADGGNYSRQAAFVDQIDDYYGYVGNAWLVNPVDLERAVSETQSRFAAIPDAIREATALEECGPGTNGALAKLAAGVVSNGMVTGVHGCLHPPWVRTSPGFHKPRLLWTNLPRAPIDKGKVVLHLHYNPSYIKVSTVLMGMPYLMALGRYLADQSPSTDGTVKVPYEALDEPLLLELGEQALISTAVILPRGWPRLASVMLRRRVEELVADHARANLEGRFLVATQRIRQKARAEYENLLAVFDVASSNDRSRFVRAIVDADLLASDADQVSEIARQDQLDAAIALAKALPRKEYLSSP